jgi:uncharacterized protein YecE (DUF72 family)
VQSFIGSGILELGPKLGPINWQLAPTKTFDPEDAEAFLTLLPHEADGQRLRHAIEVRHESFLTPDFVTLARQYGVAIVCAESDDYPTLPDGTADFVYARLQRSQSSEPAGYAAADLDRWAENARAWRDGGTPEGLPYLTPAESAPAGHRDVFIFFIAGEKVRNPAAAQALISRL